MNEGYSPSTIKEKEDLPVTKIDRDNYHLERNNSDNNSLNNSKIFFEKNMFKFYGITNSEVFLKFCNAYGLFKSNSHKLIENDILHADKIMRDIQTDLSSVRHTIARFQIAYLLRILGHASFEQIKQRININPKTLSTILNKLQESRHITKVPLLNPTIRKINAIMRFGGETSKRQFYALNYGHEGIDKYSSEIDDLIDERFKEQVINDKTYFDNAKENYESHLLVQEERNRLKMAKKGSKLDKIREALIPLINKKSSLKDILNYLHYGKGLITPSQWRGKRDEHGKYGEGMLDYLIEQGMIEIFNEHGNRCARVLPKVDKNHKTENAKLTNEEKKLLGCASHPLLDHDGTFKQNG